MDDEALAYERFAVSYAAPAAAALDGVSLRVARGEMVAVLGATGAGKSTLLKCANRLVPTLRRAELRGTLRVLGRPVDGLAVHDLADRVGFVFQDFEAQLFSTSVEEEVLFGLEQLGVDPGAMAERIRRALDSVGLAGFERRDPATLSGGEKQRLAIGAVLALEPELWLLDEPSTDLDPAGRRELFALLGRLRAKRGTLVVVEHDTEAMADADRWVVLDRGRVALAGRPPELLERPDELAALGVRPPDLAVVCRRFGVPAWPLDVERVAERLGALGRRLRAAPNAAAESAGEVVLEARSLRFAYEDQDRPALDGVDFTLRRTEFVALVGANGSGKSTLARRIAGLLDGGSGEVRWRGRPLGALAAGERAAAVGYVFQNPDEQIFAATVGEEIAFGPRQMGCAPEEVWARVRAVIEAVGLGGLEERDPFLLGKGERQKVAVASILALRPAVLILDEPTTGLDFAEQRALMDVLESLHAAGQTIVIITHVPWVVGRYARRGVLLREGRVRFDGAVAELFADEALCREADFVPPEIARLGNRLGAAAVDVERFLAAWE
ncbi:MAG: ABC transporter ATP-binding protein [Deltaproteobacteria bacterium]|nr:ABC transporter ATP-binding protein [Deltaproteobacteria bacterium]